MCFPDMAQLRAASIGAGNFGMHGCPSAGRTADCVRGHTRGSIRLISCTVLCKLRHSLPHSHRRSQSEADAYLAVAAEIVHTERRTIEPSSRCSFFSEGNTLASSCRMMDALMYGTMPAPQQGAPALERVSAKVQHVLARAVLVTADMQHLTTRLCTCSSR